MMGAGANAGRNRQALYGGFILLECVLWGLGNPVIKIGAASIPPFTGIALRFLLAFAVFVLFFGRRVWRNRGILGAPCLLVCVSTALAFTLGTFALTLTSTTTAGFLMGISVLFTPFLEPILLKTRFNWRILPLVAVVCAGMYLLCGGDGAFTVGIGEVLAVLCSLAFALMLTLSEKYIAGMDSIALSTMQCGVSGILALVLALVFEGVYDFRAMTLTSAGAAVYLALGSTCAAYILQNKAMRHIPATFASLAFCTEPIFTVLFSYLILGETLTTGAWIGGGIILAGVMTASVLKK